MPRGRIACLFVPAFPLAARLRGAPELKDKPLAVTDGKGSAARIVAATERARAGGIRAGFSAPQARALVPAVVFSPRDVEGEAAAQQALLEVAEAFSPRVEDAGPGLAFLDLYGERNEPFFAETIARRARRVGLPAQVGIAASKRTARIAAENATDGAVIVAPGDERAFLSPLPVSQIHPPAHIALTLERWGIRTLGALATLPEKGLLARLGREGLDAQKEARGLDAHPLIPRPHMPAYAEGSDLEWPIGEVDPFLYVARGLLERLTLRLSEACLGVRRLELLLKLEPDGVDARTIDLPAPTREVKTLLELLRIEMEARPPEDPIIGIRFQAQPEKPRSAQLSLFDPPALSPDGLATTLARLAALLGPDRVGSPRPVNGYRPEAFTMERFQPPAPDMRPRLPKPRQRELPFIAVRVLRPTIELDVLVQRGDQPARLRSLHTDDAHPDIQGAVKMAAGPWRVEDQWWTDTPALRDYWDVELSDGGLYRIFHDPRLGAWFADGVYD